MKKAHKAPVPKAKAVPSGRTDWFMVGGGGFALWALANIALAVSRYGAEQGNYFAFGNLMLVATAWGLCRGKRAWLIGVLALASVTEGAWIVDNLGRVFTGRHWLGLTSFLYTPGLPLDEFLLAHYPYFVIPACFFALYFMGKKPSNAFALVSALTPAALAISYLLFPARNNINCVHNTCFSAMHPWSGASYTFIFCTTVITAHLMATAWFESLFNGMRRTTQRKKTLLQAFAGAAAIAVCFTAWDARYKLSLPRLACAPAADNETVKIACDYTQESGAGTLVFAYKLQNKTSSALVCRTHAKTQYNAFVLDKAVQLAPGESRKMGQVLPYPDVSVDVALGADCVPAKERGIASQPK